MKARVTANDLETGRALLRAVTKGHEGGYSMPALDRFLDWQRECFGVSDGLARQTFVRAFEGGDPARAIRLFEAVAEPYKSNEWYNMRRALVVWALIGIALVFVLGALGGAVYLLRACS